MSITAKQLAAKLGLGNISVIKPNGPDEQGRYWGLLRCGDVKAQGLREVR